MVIDQDGEFLLYNQVATDFFGADPSCSRKDWSKYFGLYRPGADELYPAEELPISRATRGEVVTDVELFVMGETLRGRASAVEDDPARTHEVFARLRPTVPSWLPDWLNGVLVVVELEAGVDAAAAGP